MHRTSRGRDAVLACFPGRLLHGTAALLLVSCVSILLADDAEGGQAAAPNIVLIVADDK